MIMDVALESFRECKSLRDTNINSDKRAQIALSLNRTKSHIYERWDKHLKVWLLGYYTKTLNLDVRQMLANVLAEKFDKFEDVDWTSLATYPEFSGHTATSLQFLFTGHLSNNAARHLDVDHTTLTLKQIAEDAQTSYDSSKTVVSKNVQIRQEKIIAYFENFVTKSGIQNFI